MVSISHISLDRVSKLIPNIFIQIISSGVNIGIYKGQIHIVVFPPNYEHGGHTNKVINVYYREGILFTPA